MIKSFKRKYTEALSRGTNVKKFNSIAKIARRKLRQLEIANLLNDLSVPPGNHLEALKKDRANRVIVVNCSLNKFSDLWPGFGITRPASLLGR